MNNYEVPEVVELGRAQDVVLGSSKSWPVYPESPGEPEREQMTDDE